MDSKNGEGSREKWGDFFEQPRLFEGVVAPLAEVNGALYIKWPRPRLYCDECERYGVFLPSVPRIQVAISRECAGPKGKLSHLWEMTDNSPGHVVLPMRCAACEFVRRFAINIDDNWLDVVRNGRPTPSNIQCRASLFGFLPRPPLAVDDTTQRYLEKAGLKEFYRNGVIALSQGRGLGAIAYFRRVVESIGRQLLDEIAELADPTLEYAKELEKLRTTRHVGEVLKTVHELLPYFLRPSDAANPLTALYEAYSEHYHGKSDAECLLLARRLHEPLRYLIGMLALHKEQRTSYRQI